MPSTPFRVAIVAGVNPGKWTKAWTERRREPIDVTPIEAEAQRAVLVDGDADVAFVRLPLNRDGLTVIRLYEEVPFVVAAAEHPLSLYDTVTLADLDGEVVRTEAIADAIDLVVAGVGILLVPQSIARIYTRRDLVMREVTDAPVTEIALAWPADRTTTDVDEFVGIVRGRTAASSRGNQQRPGNQKQAGKQQPGKQQPPGKPARRNKTR